MKHYDKKSKFSEGLQAVNIGFKEVQTDMMYDPRDGYVMQVVSYGKWGYIDSQGNEVIPVTYDEAGDFSAGMALVKLNDQRFFIDKKGQKIRDFEYDTIWSFNDDLAMVRKDGKWGFINTQFEEIIPLMYEELSDFREGLAPAKYKDKWGYINMNNAFVIEPKYNNVTYFYMGRAEVKLENKYGCIDINGKEIMPFIYEELHIKNANIIEVIQNDRYIYFDLNGNQLTPDYNYSSSFYGKNYAVVGNGDCGKKHWPLHKKEGGKWGAIDNKGVEVIPLIYNTYHEAADKLKALFGV